MPQLHKILVVDDNAINVAIVEELLSDDYDLACASSGEEALEIARRIKPDLILLDIMMPGIDGYETCIQLRNDPALRHVKIVLVSAKAMVSERLRGYEVGADDYITKPFESEELLAKVKVFLRLKFAEELNQLKSDILMLLRHETRTPLTGIMASLDILNSGEDITTAQRRDMIDIAIKSCRRLQSLLEKSQLLCAMRAGQTATALECVSLRALVEDAVKSSQQLADKNSVSIKRDLDDIAVNVDRSLITIVVEALLNNAIRFSPESATVTISVKQEGAAVKLVVEDNGTGIEAAYMPYVLHEFTPNDIDHHSTGQGLSLAVSHEIVRLHGGTIAVESTHGDGSVFTVTFPCEPNEDGASAGVKVSALSD